jgi:hypothetical protein
MTWHAALKFCRGIGFFMQLASISNEKENNGIAKYLGDQKSRTKKFHDSYLNV